MSTTSSKPILRIWCTESLGLIISYPSGVRISAQTGGYTCQQPEIEGVYLPLKYDAKELEEYFTGPKWQGWCCNGIDEETADFIDNYLSNDGNTAYIKVDRARLQDSQEAWIYVDVFEPGGAVKEINLLSGFGRCKGVLTWDNSD